MANFQYLPGDPRLVDQLVYELKSKGIFDQFRKECISDVDTRPAYQNLRQRVESSVAAFLGRQAWKPDLNKNQLREKLRKHLLDGNYLEQGVERIVDQVVNPKVASVFVPQVEDVVYDFLGMPRKKSVGAAETSNGKVSGDNDLLPTDLEAVSPGSVKSDGDKIEPMDISETQDGNKMDVEEEKPKEDIKEDLLSVEIMENDKTEGQDSQISGISELTCHDSNVSIIKNTTTIPLPIEHIKLENIPAPDDSPPNIKNKKIDLEKKDFPMEPNISADIPLPDGVPKVEKESFFKPLILHSEEDDTSSDSSLRRNMSPLTPIRNFNNENSCDAQQGFDNDSDGKGDDKKEPSTFRFTIESKSCENSADGVKTENKDPEQALSYQFSKQVNINTFNTPLYEESSNSNNLQIDYESDANTKANVDTKLPEADQNSGDSKKERKPDEKKEKGCHKSSHRSRDSHRHSSSKDKKYDSKHSSRDSSRHDKKSSREEHKSKSSTHKEKSSGSDKKDSRESSKHRSSHKSSSSKDSKHRSSSSIKHSSKHDEKKSSSSSHKDKERSSDKSKDKSKDSKSSSHRSDKSKDRKSSSKSKHDEKENKDKKDKKETDDHYSLSGRGNPNRRSTDRDSNDGSSSSKGSHNPSNAKSSESKKDKKSTSKSDNTSNSGDSASPSDKDVVVQEAKHITQTKHAVRVETQLKKPISTPPRLPFVPDVTLKKPRFAANLEEAKRMIKMRKFLQEEQKRMNQEAALLLEFQANVRPNLSQVYSSIPGPELEFACESNTAQPTHTQVLVLEENHVLPETTPPMVEVIKSNEVLSEETVEVNNESNIGEEKAETKNIETLKDSIADSLTAMHMETDLHLTKKEEENDVITSKSTENTDIVHDSMNIENEIIQTLTNNDGNVDNQILFMEDAEIANQCDENTKVLDKETELDGNDQPKENKERTEYFEVTIITEEVSENEENQDSVKIEKKDEEFKHSEENSLHYFAEQEKYSAELERDQFSKFCKTFTENIASNKLYLINCDSYEENLVKEASKRYGQFEIVNYHKNGHLKLCQKPNNIVKNVNVATEIVLSTKTSDGIEKSVNYASPVYSPVKSECSFELSSDYDAKLEEMVNKTSRREIMEIILGNITDESPSKMPKIGYCMDSSIESEEENPLKRKQPEVESSMNNNRHILTPNKIRKLSGSDQISSTTEETEETPNNNQVQKNTRSKYLGKARRVGLPKPKKTTVPNSPSSDKSVENYSQNACVLPTTNGRPKAPRKKVQRYDTSELYKPKLHYLSRRSNVN